MLIVLQKGEADTNVFHDSSSQPQKWEEYRCLISVTAQESAPRAMKRKKAAEKSDFKFTGVLGKFT